MNKDIFSLGQEVILDQAHVIVERRAPQSAGMRAYYRKTFKKTNTEDYSYWTDYENRFLQLLAAKKLHYVVDLRSTAKNDNPTQSMDHVETFDAGLDVQKWCMLRPRYQNGTVGLHPFEHVAQFLRLIRACLLALHEIHLNGIIHGDIKADNICLFYSPYPYQPSTNELVQINFQGLKLIDFAWSVSKLIPLEHPLPINGENDAAPYHSKFFRDALCADQESRKPEKVMELDYRVDFYSLGYMAESIVKSHLIPLNDENGIRATQAAQKLGARLKEIADGMKTEEMPHLGLIESIDAWLKNLPPPEEYAFTVSDTTSQPILGSNKGRGLETPGTPLARSQHSRGAKLTPLAASIANEPVIPTTSSVYSENTHLYSSKMAWLYGNIYIKYASILLIVPFLFILYNKYYENSDMKIDNPPADGVLKLLPLKITPSPTPTDGITPPPFSPTVVIDARWPGFRDRLRDNAENGPAMVEIPPGKFMMGSPKSELGRNHANESEPHEVSISVHLAMSIYPITFDQWDTCVNDGACKNYRPLDQGWGRELIPVINVNWHDAQEYIKWLSAKTGRKYRLPTEQEWEYAARTDIRPSKSRPWGDDFGTGNANCDGCGGTWELDRIAKVGLFHTNEFKLTGMLGNVKQWVHDCWQITPPVSTNQDITAHNAECKQHTVRGSSWKSSPQETRSANRSFADTHERRDDISFRVVRDYP